VGRILCFDFTGVSKIKLLSLSFAETIDCPLNQFGKLYVSPLPDGIGNCVHFPMHDGCPDSPHCTTGSGAKIFKLIKMKRVIVTEAHFIKEKAYIFYRFSFHKILESTSF